MINFSIYKKKSFNLLQIKWLFILVFILFPIRPKAQSDTKYLNEAGVCISIVPQYILTNTYKAEIDKQIGNTSGWLVLSGLKSIRTEDYNWNFSFEEMTTYGSSFSYRHYFFSRDEPKWLYVQSGIVYNYTEVLYEGERWIAYDYNGLEAIRLENHRGVDEIHQYGADFKVGVVLKPNRIMFFDFYLGFGVREADVYGTELEDIDYGPGILGPAYEGALPVMGVRFGVNL